MRKLTTSMLFLIPGLLVLATTATAQNEFASIGFVLVGSSPQPQCATATGPDCEDETNQLTGDLFTPYYAYLCVFNGNGEAGVAGLQLGLEYDGGASSGIDVIGWTACGDQEFSLPDWPRPGSGNRITWGTDSNCQNDEPGGVGEGITAVAGFFYLSAYSPDRLEIVDWPGSIGGFPESPQVSDCSAASVIIPVKQLGSLGFSDDGSETGSMECIEQVVEEVSWGVLKDKYGNR